MPKSTPKPKAAPFTIPQIKRETVEIILIGESGLYCHRMSQKASRDLLLGGRKKTTADKANVKHHPRDEFRNSMFLTGAAPAPLIQFPAMAFKRAMRTAAIETEGVKGTTVDRLIYVEEEFAPIFGRPLLRMDITRSADMAHTPDVRTRAYFPKWATVLHLTFASPMLTRATIATLLNNAGMVVGVGDNRQERGKGSYGRFRIGDRKDLEEVMTTHEEQVAAVEDAAPDMGHGDTAVLLAEYDAEIEKRS